MEFDYETRWSFWFDIERARIKVDDFEEPLHIPDKSVPVILETRFAAYQVLAFVYREEKVI